MFNKIAFLKKTLDKDSCTAELLRKKYFRVYTTF